MALIEADDPQHQESVGVNDISPISLIGSDRRVTQTSLASDPGPFNMKSMPIGTTDRSHTMPDIEQTRVGTLIVIQERLCEESGGSLTDSPAVLRKIPYFPSPRRR
jgi:hypothetical protein